MEELISAPPEFRTHGSTYRKRQELNAVEGRITGLQLPALSTTTIICEKCRYGSGHTGAIQSVQSID